MNRSERNRPASELGLCPAARATGWLAAGIATDAAQRSTRPIISLTARICLPSRVPANSDG